MNPPYGRVRLDPAERERWSRYLYGHANFYCLFVAAGLETLDAGACFGGSYPDVVSRRTLLRGPSPAVAGSAPLLDVAFVEQRGGVFADVLQETCLAVFARRRTRRTAVGSLNGTYRGR